MLSKWGAHAVSRLLGAVAALQICAAAHGFCPQPLSPPDLWIADHAATEDGAGGALTGWMEFRPGAEGPGPAISIQRLSPQGAPLWGAPGVAITVEGPQKFELVPAGDGGALVAWQDFWDTIRIQRFSPEGAPQWAAGGLVVAPQRGYSGPLLDLVPDGAGGAYVLHVDELNDEPIQEALLLTHLGAGGEFLWSRTVRAGCSTDKVLQANAVSDRTGGVVIAEETWCGESPAVWAHRVDAAGSFLWGAPGILVVSAPGPRSGAGISASADGNWFHVVWLDNRGQPSPDNNKGTAYVQLLNAAGQLQWAPNGVPVSPQLGSAQVYGPYGVPRVAVLSRGVEAYVLWSDQPSPEPYFSNRITAQRLNGAGQPLWGNGVVIGSSYAGLGRYLTLVHGPDNSILAGWGSDEYQPGGETLYDSYAQSLDEAGNKLWGEAPYPVANSASRHEVPAGLVPTAGGQVLAFWSAEAMWVRNLPDWQSCLRRSQRLRISAAGSWWQLLKYDYTAGELGITPPVRYNAAPSYYVKPGNWAGLFLYDYAAGRFSTAVYAGLDELGAVME